MVLSFWFLSPSFVEKRFSGKTKRSRIHLLGMSHWHSAMNGKVFTAEHLAKFAVNLVLTMEIKIADNYESFHLCLPEMR